MLGQKFRYLAKRLPLIQILTFNFSESLHSTKSLPKIEKVSFNPYNYQKTIVFPEEIKEKPSFWDKMFGSEYLSYLKTISWP